jgi:AraC-like DNA-binding protein
LAYVQHLRIDRAKALLEVDSLSVDAISRKVGYEDVAFCNRLFKRMSGLPTQRLPPEVQYSGVTGWQTGRRQNTGVTPQVNPISRYHRTALVCLHPDTISNGTAVI